MYQKCLDNDFYHLKKKNNTKITPTQQLLGPACWKSVCAHVCLYLPLFFISEHQLGGHTQTLADAQWQYHPEDSLH